MLNQFDKLKTLSSRILLVVLPTVLISLLLLYSLISLQIYQSLRTDLVSDLNELAMGQSSAVAEAVWEYDQQRINDIIEQIGSNIHIINAVVYDTNGEVLGSAGKLDTVPESPDLVVQSPLSYSTSRGNENIGKFVVTASSRQLRKQAFSTLVQNWIVLFITAIILAFTITLMIKRHVSQPLKDFVKAAGELSKVDFSDAEIHVNALPLSRSDEMGNLARSFEQMYQQLRHSYSSLEGMVEERTSTLEDQLTLQQALIDTIPNPIFYKDADTRFLGVNTAYENIFNVKASELVGLRVLDLEYLPEEERKRYQAEDEDVINRQTTVKRETQIIFADGKVHDTLYWVSGFRKRDGSPGGLVGTFVDISEEKDVAKQLEKAKNVAESATEAKANFLASMSHEIRTPMNGIIGMVDLLRQEEMGAEQKQMLQVISDSGQALLAIINDILDISKIEAGKLQIEAIPMSVLEIVEGAVETLKQAALKKHLTLLTYIAPDIPSLVLGDPVRIRQILVNLVGNAVKFTDEGEVFVRVDRMQATDDKITLRFSVIDEGIGIPGEVQEGLFSEFSQADASTTRKYGGTGLGLSICYRLATLMQGSIDVESTPGKGSRFFADIPLKYSTETPEAATGNDLSGLSIAIISSSKNETYTCCQYLEHWNANVDTYNDVEKFRETIFNNEQPLKPLQIVVLGYSIPRDSKFRLRDELAERFGSGTIRVVALVSGRRLTARLENHDTVLLDVNPVKRIPFLEAVAIAAGRASPETKPVDLIEDLSDREAPSIEEALAANELILVAEDNPTNRDVINRQLKRLGYTCEIKEDGKEALGAWTEKNYALLLTDCHMPEMDGFELTAGIRELESGTGKRKPIIAITANALEGEAERCIAAGMDDYISKPIDMKVLQTKLVQWLPQTKSDDMQRPDNSMITTSKIEADASNVIDESALKDVFGDDEDTFREILTDFVTPSREIILELKKGWEDRSAEAVKQASHKLKSSARSVGANGLADLCAKLEIAGRDADWTTINACLPGIHPLMDEIESYIMSL